MKKKWIALLAAILAVIMAALVFCYVFIFPKMVLLRALDATVSQWAERWQASPISMLADHLNAESRYDLQLETRTENDLAGEITYSMAAQTDGTTNQFHASGTASAAGISLELSIYMDKNFMALSSQQLLDGVYYGITYDSFSADIRSIPLLSLVVGEETLAEWEASVADIQAKMGKSYCLPEMPALSDTDWDEMIEAVLLLPGQMAGEEITIGGQTLKCRRITYSAEGEQAEEILQYLMDSGENPAISVSFYVCDGQLVCVSFAGSTGETSAEYVLELPLSAGTLTLRVSLYEGGEGSAFTLAVTSEQTDGYSYESWAYYPNFQGAGEVSTLSYRWDADAGEMVIDGETPITLYLSEAGESLQIVTEDFDLLIDLLSGDTRQNEREPVSCAMTLTQGSGIDAPEYKNLGTWTLSDFLSLLGGAGALFGLAIG